MFINILNQPVKRPCPSLGGLETYLAPCQTYVMERFYENSFFVK